MKWLMVFLVVALAGCSGGGGVPASEATGRIEVLEWHVHRALFSVNIIRVDSHEYIFTNGRGGGVIHNLDCPNH